MAPTSSDAIKVGLVVGIGVLALLFVGQVVTFTARWLSRAISGGIMILLAVGLGYAAYEIFAGWTAANEEDHSDLDESELNTNTAFNTDTNDLMGEPEDNESVSEQELEEELEALIEDAETTNSEVTREVE